MSRSNISGFTELPIVIILSVLLGAVALGLGIRGFEQTNRLTDEQRSIQSFHKLVEMSTEVSYGDVNGEKRVRLDLPESKIQVKQNLIRLKSDDGIKKVEALPLPLRKGCKDEFTMESGTFSLRLEYDTFSPGGTDENQMIVRVRRTD